jgi:hypothetical protein
MSGAVIDPICYQYYIDCDYTMLYNMAKTSRSHKSVCQKYLTSLREESKPFITLLDNMRQNMDNKRYEIEFSPDQSFVISVTDNMTNDSMNLLRYIHKYGYDFNIYYNDKMLKVRFDKDMDNNEPFLGITEFEIVGGCAIQFD